MAQSILKMNKKQEIIVYSEGESDCEFEIRFKDLKDTAKIARMYYHWR